MKRNRSIYTVLLVLIVAILLNFISSFKFGRIDLTEEKIHSLSSKTIEILENDSLLNDELRFEIYLEGDLPAELRKLQLAVKEKLNEFRAYGGDNIYYEFVDPSINDDRKSEVYKQLQEQGLFPTIISSLSNGTKKDMIVFGGLLIRTPNNKVVPVQLLQGSPYPVEIGPNGINSASINSVITNLEFKLLNGLYKALNPERKRIGFLQGHGELKEIERAYATFELAQFHIVEDVTINGKLLALKDLDALVIAKPTQPIPDKDQYIIDQFIMNGGKVAWLVDPVEVNLDSLKLRGQTIGLERDLNRLDQQIFTYGARINKDLVVDVNAAKIYFKQGQRAFPWYYYPKITSDSTAHPVFNNVDPVKLQYASSIDLLKTKNVLKTPLLVSSKSTIKYNVPVRINYQMISLDPNHIVTAAKPNLVMAAMLEGEFPSYFRNRLPDNFVKNSSLSHKDKSLKNKMLVISDGDIIRNEVQMRETESGKMVEQPFPLDREMYERQDRGLKYGNREFFANAIESLLGIDDIKDLRSKTIAVRALNKQKVEKERSFWQMLNVGLPIIVILVFAGFQFAFRRKRFAS